MAQVPYTGVPSLAPQGPNPNLRENIQSSPADFGATSAAATREFGRDAQSAGGNFMSAAITQQEVYNRAAVQDATTKAMDLGQSILHHPETGYLATQGRVAMDGYEPTIESIKSKFQETRDGLKNDAQRAAFDADSRRYMYYYQQAAGSHANREAKTWYNQTGRASQENAVQVGATMYNDPSASASQIKRGIDAITQEAIREGHPPEWTSWKYREFLGKYAYRQLQSQSLHDPAGALERYEQGGIPGPEPDPEHPGQFVNKIIPFRDLIDQSGHESLIRPLITRQENAAIASDIDRRLNGARPPTSGGARILPAPIRQQIISRSTELGVDPNVALTINRIEQPDGVDAPGNSHKGLFQLGESEWREFGGTPENRGDLSAQADVGVGFLASAQKAASDALGRKAEGWETYLAHQQGRAGGPALLKADPDENAIDALTPAYKGNRAAATQAILRNGGTADMTAGQFKNLWRDKYVRNSGTGARDSGAASARAATGETQLSPAEDALPDIEKVVQGITEDYPDILKREKAISQARQQYNIRLQAVKTDHDAFMSGLPDTIQTALDGKEITYSDRYIRHILPPAKAASTIESLAAAKTAGQQLKSAWWAPPAEVYATYQRLAEGLGGAPGKTRISPQGVVEGLDESGNLPKDFAAGPEVSATSDEDLEGSMQRRFRHRILNYYTAKIHARNQALATDPMSLVPQHPLMVEKSAALNAVVKAATGATAPDDPRVVRAKEAQDAYFQQALSIQNTLGVPSSAQHLMPKQQAQSIVRDLTTSSPADLDFVGAVNKMKSQYGDKYWGKAYGDLVTLGGMPGQYQVLATMDKPDQAGGAVRLQTALKVVSQHGKDGGFAKVAEGVGDPDKVKLINATVDSKLSDFRRTVAYSPGGTQLYNHALEATKLLAYMNAARGDSDSTALNSAVDDIFNKKYDFHDTWRSEKEYSAAASEAAFLLPKVLTVDDIAAPNGDARIKEVDRKREFLSAVRSQGKWLNTPDESGIILTHPARGEYVPVLRADGTPIIINFKNIPAPPSGYSPSQGMARGLNFLGQGNALPGVP